MPRKNAPGQGRRPVPTAVKLARGTDRDHHNQRSNKAEPDSPAGRPRCPSHLDSIAKAEWRHICKIMEGMGTLSPAYQRSLELYVTAYSNYRRALEQVEKHGQAIVGVDKNGQTVVGRNPFSAEAHRWRDACMRLLTEFGLTPSSKTRVMDERKETGQTSDWAKFMAGSKH